MINASDLLGAPQIAGVVVSPVGLFRKIESSQTAFVGGVVVPGKLGVRHGEVAPLAAVGCALAHRGVLPALLGVALAP